MKQFITTSALVVICFIYACTKESSSVGSLPSPTLPAGSTSHHMSHAAARLSGSDYSQSISVDTANKMLESYFRGIGFPSVDTTLRSLSFDADTLRAYLQNSNIVTIKFMFAHPPAYMASGKTGVNSGLTPGGLTLIIAGLDNDDRYVLNSRNGVYDYMSPCPLNCQGNSSGYIQ